MPRYPTDPSDLRTLRAAADAHGVGTLARAVGVARRTAADAVAGEGVLPATRRALLDAAARLGGTCANDATGPQTA